MAYIRIVLKDSEAEEYLRLRQQHERLAALEETVNQLVETVTTFMNRQEELVSEASAQLNSRLDALAQQIADAQTHIESVVTAESAEDQEQNTRLAAKQAELEQANAEIQRLRDQLAQGVSADEATAISDRIATLAEQVVALSAASQVTDPGAPSA